MYKLEINNDLDSLKSYMLYSVNNFLTKPLEKCFVKNIPIDKNTDKNTDMKISKFLSNPNYNKFKSKYYETDYYKQNYDKLFWCYYKIINNYEEDDMQNINIFKTEKDYKIKLVESIYDYKQILKNNKFKINKIVDELTNSKNISINTFSALCFCNNISILLYKDNKTYSIINKKIVDNKYIFDSYIKLFYNSSSSLSNNYKISQEELSNKELENILTTFFYIENIEKPLKALSSYKIADLMTIASKLDINIYNDVSKRKNKETLYSEIIKILS